MQVLLTTTGTQNPVVLQDQFFGKRQFAHPTTDYNLLQDYSLNDILQSTALTSAISAGTITVSTEEGNVVTAAVDAPLFNAGRVVNVPVDDSTRQPKYLLYYNDVTQKLAYEDPGQLATGRAIYSLSFYTSSSPYIEYSSTNWQVAAQFPYIGTTQVAATSLYVITSRNGTSGLSEVRVWDATNSLEVAYISWVEAETTLRLDSTLLNLPVGPAVFELQVKKNATASSKSRMHSMILY